MKSSMTKIVTYWDAPIAIGENARFHLAFKKQNINR